MALECYSHSRVLEAMNGIHEQAQEARGSLCRFLVFIRFRVWALSSVETRPRFANRHSECGSVI